jgi:hypothetical protein
MEQEPPASRWRQMQNANVIASGIAVKLSLRTMKGERIEYVLRELYYESGIPFLVGTNLATNRTRRFRASELLSIRIIKTGEISNDPVRFLQVEGPKLGED